MWTLFVLDFDGTYDNEDEDSTGVEPSVYLIPLEKQLEVERYAWKAHNLFHEDEDECDYCIGDYFEELLTENDIEYQHIGNMEITFGERQVDYLADYIPRVIV